MGEASPGKISCSSIPGSPKSPSGFSPTTMKTVLSMPGSGASETMAAGYFPSSPKGAQRAGRRGEHVLHRRTFQRLNITGLNIKYKGGDPAHNDCSMSNYVLLHRHPDRHHIENEIGTTSTQREMIRRLLGSCTFPSDPPMFLLSSASTRLPASSTEKGREKGS